MKFHLIYHGPLENQVKAPATISLPLVSLQIGNVLDSIFPSVGRRVTGSHCDNSDHLCHIYYFDCYSVYHTQYFISPVGIVSHLSYVDPGSYCHYDTSS